MKRKRRALYNIDGGLFEAGSKVAAGRARSREIHLRQNMSIEAGLVYKV